jgi:xanthine dehydrogenase YagR molybdenum-binding subunit
MSIGQALSRPEGPRKVTGKAKYAADNTRPRLLYAVICGAPIAAGRVVAVHRETALAYPGVARVLTRADMPKFGKLGPPAAVLNLPMQTDEIRHEGEAVAIVLGESLEAAEAGAALVRVETQAAKPLVAGSGKPDRPPEGVPLGADFSKGDFQAGLRSAAHRLNRRYEQPARHHNTMETSATLAEWNGDKLTMYDAVQAGFNVPMVLSAAFGLPAENIRVIAPHTGGGFGCKGFVWPHQILAAAAARIVSRPVRLALTRSQMYATVGYQQWMRQDVELGAQADGKLTALRHEIVNSTALLDTHFEPSSDTSKTLYACPAILTKQTLERVNANLPTPMRAPVEGPGTWALESAMDELAHELKMDPLDLRLINYAETDPHTGKPWSSKKLREAYAEGARLFGWRERASKPRQDGFWRIGYGMATATMGNFRFPGAARVRLKNDGTAVVETGTHDIGTGTTTIFPQIAADVLGLDPSRVSIQYGDTTLPRAGPVYGSSATMGTGSAVHLAAQDVKKQLARLVSQSGDHADISAVMKRAGVSSLVGEARFALPEDAPFEGDGSRSSHAMRTWGAIFVEVGVDPDFGLIRLRRAVGSYSAGRIINAKTARSQMIGGIIWGWGMATMEESVQEPRYGRWLAKNLSNVAIPVNADIPADITIHFVDEFDPHASTIGARGIGELAGTGITAAVANAVYDAIGVRVRELPILPSKLLMPRNES